MHELAITRNIVAIVAEAAKGRKVRRVTLNIGRLSGVMSDAIAFCFPLVAEGTGLAGAALDIRNIEARGRCTACGSEFDTPALHTACACGCRSIHRLSGEELTVATMELEDAA